MTKQEAKAIARVIENGAGVEGHDNVRDMCDGLNEANLNYKFIFNEGSFVVEIKER